MNPEYNFKQAPKNTPPEPYPKKRDLLLAQQHTYLRSRNLDPSVARFNQWYPTELLGPRIVIPCTEGFWQARTMCDHPMRYRSAGGSRNKAFCIVWPIHPQPTLTVIVEGPMDALAAAGEGAVGIASLGAGFGDYVIDWVFKNREASNIIIIPDLDNSEFGYDVVCGLTNLGRKVTLKHPQKKDLAGMTVKQRRVLLGLN